MSQPTRFSKTTTYTGDAYDGSDLDRDFDDVQLCTDGLCDNLALIQRDDGKLHNDSVHPDSLDSATLALIFSGTTLPRFTPRGEWATLTAYAIGDMVEVGTTGSYVSVTAHVSGAVFATDKAAGKWISLSGLSLGNSASTSAGEGSALLGVEDAGGYFIGTTVEAVLQEIGGRPVGMRNHIINGDFSYEGWQRSTSQTGNGYGSDDRWDNENIGSTKTHSRQTFALGQTDVPGNPEFYSRTVVTSVAGAGNYCAKRQKIESVLSNAGLNTVISFWAKADAAKPIAIEFAQNFGTGGGPSAEVTGIGSQKFNLTTTWQKFTAVVAIPSISGKTLGTSRNDYLMVRFWFDAGSNFNARTATLGQQSGTYDISRVQVEPGSIATPFEYRSPAQRIALNQRYFEKSYPLNIPPGTITAAGRILYLDVSANGGYTIRFQEAKLKAPVMAGYSPSTGNVGSYRDATSDADFAVAFSNANEFSAEVSLSTHGAGNEVTTLHFTADAEL